MSSHEPDDWPRLFEQMLNAGDIEAVMALYEPGARFVPRSGETVVGRDRIRHVMAELIRTKTRLHGRVIKEVTVDDIALPCTDFQGTMVDSSGETVEVRHKAIEVLRRQPDGTWKLIVGYPNGRAGEGERPVRTMIDVRQDRYGRWTANGLRMVRSVGSR